MAQGNEADTGSMFGLGKAPEMPGQPLFSSQLRQLANMRLMTCTKLDILFFLTPQIRLETARSPARSDDRMEE